MIHYLLLILSAVVYYLLGYETVRENFGLLIALYGINGLVYLYWLATVRDKQYVNRLLLGSVLLRAVFLFATPNLSDDVYRFIWDGKKIIRSESPYAGLPEKEYDSTLYEKLNSKNYYSVYPPVNQLFFAVAGYYYNHSEHAAIISLRILLLIFEILMIILLRKMLIALKMAQWKSLIYALNPLVIVEISGNLHFEGVMLFFLLLSWWLYSKQKSFWSGISFGLAVGVKLSVLIFLPYLLWILRKHIIAFLGGFMLSFTVIFCWFYFHPNELHNFLQSIDLYFHTFEFNASVYYIVRAVGESILGYNPIKTAGTWLSIISFSAIMLIYLFSALKPSDETGQKFNFCPLLWAYSLYLLLATTVHPWYVVNLVFLAVFCSKSWYAIFWSLMVVVSYSAYQQANVSENMLLITLEYTVVFLVFVYEYFISVRKRGVI